MIKQIKMGPALHDGFEVREANGRLTRVFATQGLDLVLHQVHEKIGVDSMIRHYSSPGYSFYACLIKFLHGEGKTIPEIRAPPEPGPSELETPARIAAGAVAVSDFPIEYSHERATIEAHKVEHDGGPALEFRPEGKKIVVGIELAEALLNAIPKIYPNLQGFEKARQTFMEEMK